jgi:uncharacterized membrane protein YbaN (DUF454 family)
MYQRTSVASVLAKKKNFIYHWVITFNDMSERGSMERGLWIGAGTIFLAIGAIGVAVPLLPTTPFLLLAAFCYARGSKRLYNWLLEHRYLGIYLRAYERGEGVGNSAKALSLLLLWGTMMATIVFLVDNVVVMLVIVAIGLGVSVHIITIKAHPAS